jgi:hypothetical protein
MGSIPLRSNFCAVGRSTPPNWCNAEDNSRSNHSLRHYHISSHFGNSLSGEIIDLPDSLNSAVLAVKTDNLRKSGVLVGMGE